MRGAGTAGFLNLGASLALALMAVVPTPSNAQTSLPVDRMRGGVVPGGAEPAEYVFEARKPGFLSVVVRDRFDADLFLSVSDEFGQTLLDGRTDVDRLGDLGSERLLVAVPRRGGVRVMVGCYDCSGAEFDIGATFLESDAAALPDDEDGTPRGAREMGPGESRDDHLDMSTGDLWDWYRITVDQPGKLTLLTRAETGDLQLEVYDEGDYSTPHEFSDADEGGVLGNETVTLDVEAGATVYVRVTARESMGVENERAVSYRFASGFIPR
ncbi:MAG: hypothetical protein OEZ65_11605 [Gemmatimonadota bacterium]|nr:hypothetical protein [Gemmatimonadota bacterium]